MVSSTVIASSPASRSISAHISARASGSRPVVGSSRNSTSRPVHQPDRHVELAAHPARPGAHQPVGGVGDAEPARAASRPGRSRRPSTDPGSARRGRGSPARSPSGRSTAAARPGRSAGVRRPGRPRRRPRRRWPCRGRRGRAWPGSSRWWTCRRRWAEQPEDGAALDLERRARRGPGQAACRARRDRTCTDRPPAAQAWSSGVSCVSPSSVEGAAPRRLQVRPERSSDRLLVTTPGWCCRTGRGSAAIRTRPQRRARRAASGPRCFTGSRKISSKLMPLGLQLVDPAPAGHAA